MRLMIQTPAKSKARSVEKGFSRRDKIGSFGANFISKSIA